MNRREFAGVGVGGFLGAASTRAVGGGPLIVLISQEPNSQFGVNQFEPKFLLKPRVSLRLRNPGTGDGGDIPGFIDTGADACSIGVGLASKIGLKATADHAARALSATGSFLESKVTLIEMQIVRPDGVIYEPFGRKETPFYLNEGLEQVILGVHGFLDQFQEIRLSYRKRELTLVP
jgi:hypothetical protein